MSVLLQVWGCALQSPAGSNAIYFPLGLSDKPRKEAAIQLATAVTKREEGLIGLYYSLQPLPSRELDGAGCFIHDNGERFRARLLDASQRAKYAGLNANES